MDWIIDSGCTNHSCNNRKAFKNFQNKRSKITIADGSQVWSSGKGTVGQFTNVIYVPEFKYNLLSVNQLTEDGYVVIFNTEGKVIVFKDEHSQILGEFTCGVYETTTNTTTSLSTTVRDQSSRHMIQPAPPSDLIHQRWGHAFIQRLIDAQKRIGSTFPHHNWGNSFLRGMCEG